MTRSTGRDSCTVWIDGEEPDSSRRYKMVYHGRGSLYAFWVSPDVSGASYGCVAAGGPGFASFIDLAGTNGSGQFRSGAEMPPSPLSTPDVCDQTIVTGVAKHEVEGNVPR